jgi:hypothetical protein
MGKIVVHGGDFRKGSGHALSFGNLKLIPNGKLFPETIPLSDVRSVELTNQESVPGYSKSVAAVATMISPTGAVAGMMAAGRKSEMTFVATLSGGRRMFATTDAATYKKIAGAAFDQGSVGAAGGRWNSEDIGANFETGRILTQCAECAAWSESEKCQCGAQKPQNPPRRWIAN